MESFKGENIIDFFDTFKTDLACLEYLASIKWKDDFKLYFFKLNWTFSKRVFS